MTTSSEHLFPIFISSTDYNLIDLRAELARFLRELGYHPILSSAEGFPDRYPECEPWESCLYVLSNSYIVILIIDGRYGQTLQWDAFKELVGGRQISPTHAEYLHAHREGKRLLVFVRDTVMSCYRLYRSAKEKSPDREQLLKNMANVLPQDIPINTLEFLEEVKTTRPIPWIKTFQDVTEIKEEIQKKLLNEIAELYIAKDKRLTVIMRTFSDALSGLDSEKKREVLEAIGVTKELIQEKERSDTESKRLTQALKDVNTQLSDAKKESQAVASLGTEKTKLEARVKELEEHEKQLKKELNEERNRGASAVLSGTTTSYLPSMSGLLDMPLANLGYLNVCSGCGKESTQKGLFVTDFKTCSSCGKQYCESCWPPLYSSMGQDVRTRCPNCQGSFGL